MNLTLFTWNSLNINNSSPFQSYFPRGQKANLSAQPVTVQRNGDFPLLVETRLSATTLQIGVIIAAGQNINTNREILKKYFNITDRVKHQLIAKDADDSDKQYYVNGFVIGVNNLGSRENEFIVTFALDYPYWQLVTAISDAWPITDSGGTGGTTVVNNTGTLKVAPVFTFTPTTTKSSGLTYRRLVAVYNNLDKTFNFPLEITDGGIDTATLISGGKMQADGDDFRVWANGQFVDRWLNGVGDTGGTRCWINISLSPRIEAALLATVNDSVDTLSFAETSTNLQFLQDLKKAPNKVLLIESEMIVFEADNINTATYQITSVIRGAKGTTAASHTIPQTVRHIEYDLWILYGDDTLSAPDVDDNFKPIFDLDSDNNSLSYTNFFDTTSQRPGAWKGEIRKSKTKLSRTFTGNQDTLANPSTELGLAMINTSDFQIANEIATIDWIYLHPSGITDLVYSGDKYFNTTSWPGVAGLQRLEPDGTWTLVQAEVEPSSADSWQSFGPRSVALGDTGDYYYSVRFVMDGQLDSLIDEVAKLQFDTLTSSIYASNLPTISLGSEEAINFFDITLTNVTTGEYLKVKTICPVDDTLTIDCVNKKAYLSDGTPVKVSLSTDREAWLDLSSGNNTLEFVDAGTVAVTGAVSHRDRIL